MDRKLDCLMKGLKRCNVSVEAIQKAKWFCSNLWRAEGYAFLHSHHLLPSSNKNATRKEGVGITLDEKATAAWRVA